MSVDMTRVFASTGTTNEPAANDVENGHGTVTPPKHTEENWWKNRADLALKMMQQRGVMDWHASVAYFTGVMVWYSGNFYVARSNNTGQQPDITPSVWVLSGPPGRMPVGTPGFWLASTPPPGALERDGTLLLVADYPALFAVIGNFYGGDGVTDFALPDDRGLFERGYDPLATRDPTGDTRGFGSYQASDNLAHTHGSQSFNLTGAIGVASGVGAGLYGGVGSGTYSSGNATEARPQNRNYLAIVWAY